MPELTFIFLYIICAVSEAFLMCINHKYYGDVEGAAYNLSTFQVSLYLLIFVMLWLGMYYFYCITKKNKGSNRGIKCFVNPKINYFLIIWFSIYILYTLNTGIGKAGSNNNANRYSIIFSMFDINVIFPIYYILFRCNKKYRKLFIINVILYCVLKLMQGWTGFIVNIFMYELFFYYRNRHSQKNVIKSIFLVTFIIFGGAFLYRIMYPLKMAIRYNYQFTMKMTIPYSESLSKLTSRFSTFCRGTYVLYNMDSIKYWYIGENKFLLEIQDSIRSIVPRAVMPDKDFMSMSACTFASIYNERMLGSSSSPGIFPYIVTLFYCDPISGVIWLLQFIIYYLVMRKIYSSLEVERNGQMDILYFQLIISMLITGSINVNFTQQAMKLIFIVPVLLMFGMIKLRRLNYVERLTQVTHISIRNVN